MRIRSGKYLKLIRLLNNCQQAELAVAIKTKQGIVAQIETNKYNINPYYANVISKLFSLNSEFLLKLHPPVFTEDMTVFSIFPSDKTSTQLLNQVDHAIRTELPSLCSINLVDDIYIWSTGQVYEWSKRFRASLFMFLSSTYNQFILIKVKEDSRDQFFSALLSASKEIGFEENKIIDITFGGCEDFFSEDGVGDEEETQQFLNLLEMAEIPEHAVLAEKYSKTKPSQFYWQSEKRKHLQEQIEFNSENRNALKTIADIMRKKQITIKELSMYLEKGTKEDI